MLSTTTQTRRIRQPRPPPASIKPTALLMASSPDSDSDPDRHSWTTLTEPENAAAYRWSTCTLSDELPHKRKSGRVSDQTCVDSDSEPEDEQQQQQQQDEAEDDMLDILLARTAHALEHTTSLLLDSQVQVERVRSLHADLDAELDRREASVRSQLALVQRMSEHVTRRSSDLSALVPRTGTATAPVPLPLTSPTTQRATSFGTLEATDRDATIGKSAARRLERMLQSQSQATPTSSVITTPAPAPAPTPAPASTPAPAPAPVPIPTTSALPSLLRRTSRPGSIASIVATSTSTSTAPTASVSTSTGTPSLASSVVSEEDPASPSSLHDDQNHHHHPPALQALQRLDKRTSTGLGLGRPPERDGGWRSWNPWSDN